jgi:uncharacterized protein YdiU (UPF0061 family)
MEAEQLDKLIEDIEMLSVDISKINFNLDGLKEDTDKMVETKPFLKRQIQLNEKKMYRLSNTLVDKMHSKHDLDAKLNAYKASLPVKKPEEKPEKESKSKPNKTSKKMKSKQIIKESKKDTNVSKEKK